MKTILVVREFDKFSKVLAENEFEIINLPLIKTVLLEDLKEFETRLANIESFDGIFLTSAKASVIFVQKLRELKISFSGKVFVLGARSFDLLQNEKLNLFYDETANTAREMLEKIAPEELKNKRFLFVRGEQSLRVVPEFLGKYAAVEETIVYRTKKIAPKIDKIKAIRERIEKNEIACACFFSPSAVEVFFEHFDGHILHLTNIAAIGKTTANCLEKRNLKVDFISPKASAEDFANWLIGKLK
jgi:uroporphyrinogen-III synthase